MNPITRSGKAIFARFIGVAVLLIFGSQELLHAQSANKDIQFIKSVYAKRRLATIHKDIQGQWRYVSPQWIGTAKTGKIISYQQQKQNDIHIFAMAKTITVKVSSRSFVEKPNQILVTGKGSTEIYFTDSRVNHGKPFQEEASVVDTWEKKNGQWLETKSKVLNDKIY